MQAGLLPVKSPAVAKSRLSSLFDPPQRVLLAHALLEDALHLCRRVRGVHWWVVTGDPEVRAVALGHGFEVLEDTGEGLNAALGNALEHVAALGAEAALILPSDAPLTTPEDIEMILDTGATSDVVLVASGDDGGTNGMFIAPPTALDPAFGPGSLQEHLRRAEADKLRVSVLDLPRLALDIDTPADIDRLRAIGTGTTETEKVLARAAPQPPAEL